MASEIRVNSLTNRSGLSTVSITDTGAVVAGLLTATTFSGPLTGAVTGNVTGDLTGNVTGNVTGNLTGDVTGNTSGTAGGLSGSPSITVTDITATGNVSIGGTLTYEDVTNIDSVGIVTAQSDVLVGRNLSVTSGISTFKTLDYAAIDSTISDTAVDVFIYDTSKDSDGGAWRKRTQHTSWYNETLNTATRGSRREFPAVAVIVAESTQVTIYDGDDPDLPMWMVFDRPTTSIETVLWAWSNVAPTGIVALNGIISFSTTGSSRFRTLNFINEVNYTWDISGGQSYRSDMPISKRNSSESNISYRYPITGTVASRECNDVAMTVLPNAPIDSATGLPVPTIAIATNGGVSVIKDDGTVVDITGQIEAPYRITFNRSNPNEIITSGYWTRVMKVYDIPTSDINENAQKRYYVDSQAPKLPFGSGAMLFESTENQELIVKVNGGTPSNGFYRIAENLNSKTNGMNAYIRSDCNTGWMHGDIKGAFLSDTDATNVTGSELVTNGTFDNTNASSVSSWDNVSVGSGTISEGSGYASLNRVDGSSTGRIGQGMDLIAGKSYFLSFDIVAGSTSGVQLRQYNSSTQGLSGVTRNFSGSTARTESFFFTCESGYDGFILIPIDNTNTTCRIDNFTVKKAEEDRSVNSNPLQVFGTITKSPVAGSGATAAELVKYGGFGSGVNANALVQPYNTAMDWGTGDFHYMIWVYHRNAANLHGIISRQTDGQSSGNRFQFQSDTDSQYDLYSGSNQTGMGAVKLGVWSHLAIVRSGSSCNFYQDGISVRSWTDSTNYTNSGANLRVGGLSLGTGINDNQYAATGVDFALFRTGASAPSAEQIKKMYEDEKVLFQENAACTLYGSSDAVTALAYDDDTDLLHAGTSSGRSDFQGLRRINNTTTAVTTAITAQNEFIIEQ